MSNILILSRKQILKKEEEEALSRDNVRVTTLEDYDTGLSRGVTGDYDYILLDNALGSTDIYRVRRVGSLSGRESDLINGRRSRII
jgi:DNA-binding response OmpR family regulator